MHLQRQESSDKYGYQWIVYLENEMKVLRPETGSGSRFFVFYTYFLLISIPRKYFLTYFTCSRELYQNILHTVSTTHVYNHPNFDSSDVNEISLILIERDISLIKYRIKDDNCHYRVGINPKSQIFPIM